ncbi:MAG: LytR family transcriptional regulator, partial [Mycobacterium sp.]
MNTQRALAAAALAATVGMSAMLNTGFANAFPMDPAPCPGCTQGPGPGGGPHAPQTNEPHSPASTAPASTAPASTAPASTA